MASIIMKFSYNNIVGSYWIFNLIFNLVFNSQSILLFPVWAFYTVSIPVIKYSLHILEIGLQLTLLLPLPTLPQLDGKQKSQFWHPTTTTTTTQLTILDTIMLTMQLFPTRYGSKEKIEKLFLTSLGYRNHDYPLLGY